MPKGRNENTPVHRIGSGQGENRLVLGREQHRCKQETRWLALLFPSYPPRHNRGGQGGLAKRGQGGQGGQPKTRHPGAAALHNTKWAGALAKILGKVGEVDSCLSVCRGQGGRGQGYRSLDWGFLLPLMAGKGPSLRQPPIIMHRESCSDPTWTLCFPMYFVVVTHKQWHAVSSDYVLSET